MKKAEWKKETLHRVSSQKVAEHITKRARQGWEFRSCEYFPGNITDVTPQGMPSGYHFVFVREKQ